MSLPSDAAARKNLPLFSGLVAYFPHALAAVAELSKIGNDQHNPGQPLHWAKEKSSDELDALMRHVADHAIDPAHRDPDGVLAAVKIAWRALANLERMYDAGQRLGAVAPLKNGEIGNTIRGGAPYPINGPIEEIEAWQAGLR